MILMLYTRISICLSFMIDLKNAAPMGLSILKSACITKISALRA
jgi:hypothetical protein